MQYLELCLNKLESKFFLSCEILYPIVLKAYFKRDTFFIFLHYKHLKHDKKQK